MRVVFFKRKPALVLFVCAKILLTIFFVTTILRQTKHGKPEGKMFDTNFQQYYHTYDGVRYPQYLYLSQNKTINYNWINHNMPIKLILAWNSFYGDADFGYGLGKVNPFLKHNCPVTNCEVTNDKTRLDESDFVMVSLTDPIVKPIPSYRGGKARWVSIVIESPVHTPSYSQFNGVFNLTGDYLVESEFGINYESQKRFLWSLNTSFDDTHDYSAGKTGFMGALISNCNAWHNRRLDYINELRKYVTVDIYGRCGTPCPSNVDCREMVGAKYKFYFAFENSNCKDYITEKFFQMLKFDVIVVAFGGGNYTRFVSKTFFNTK